MNQGETDAIKVLVEFTDPADTMIVKEKLDKTTNEELGLSFRAFFSQVDEVNVIPNNPFNKGKPSSRINRA